jgi:hypothetical protein
MHIVLMPMRKSVDASNLLTALRMAQLTDTLWNAHAHMLAFTTAQAGS